MLVSGHGDNVDSWCDYVGMRRVLSMPSHTHEAGWSLNWLATEFFSDAGVVVFTGSAAVLSKLAESDVLRIHTPRLAGIGRSDWLHLFFENFTCEYRESLLNLQKGRKRR